MKSKYKKKYRRNQPAMKRSTFFLTIFGSGIISFFIYFIISQYLFFSYQVKTNEMSPEFRKGERIFIWKQFNPKDLLNSFVLIRHYSRHDLVAIRRIVAGPADEIVVPKIGKVMVNNREIAELPSLFLVESKMQKEINTNAIYSQEKTANRLHSFHARYRLQKDEYFILGIGNTAIDSRLWGKIKKKDIIGVIYRP